MAQSGYPCMNLLTSRAILCHQKQTFSSERVPLAPGCIPGGQPGGSEVETLGVRMDSGAYWMGHRNMSSGRMGSGSWLSSSGVWRRDNASAFRFRDLGL